MNNDKLNFYTKDELLSLGIYELRDLGRDVGVPSPTTLKKEELVDKIIGIVYGDIPKRAVGKGRGRPVRAKDKPNRIFVDLIEKLETPKCDSTFVYSKNNSAIEYEGNNFLSTMVAAAQLKYVNDAESSENQTLKSGVVCEEEGKLVVRKFKFIKNEFVVEIPSYLVDDFCLKENDTIDYLLDDDGQTIVQIFRINGNLAKRKVRPKQNGIEQNVYVEDYQIVLNASNLIYVPTVQDRARVVDLLCSNLGEMGYNTVKVCFDRNVSNKNKDLGVARAEIYSSYVGDEFETMAMAETGIEKAVFFSMLEKKSVLVIDNLAWLNSVIETYPSTLYGNFIEKMVKTCQNSGISLVCFTGHMNNSKIKEISTYFDKVN